MEFLVVKTSHGLVANAVGLSSAENPALLATATSEAIASDKFGKTGMIKMKTAL